MNNQQKLFVFVGITQLVWYTNAAAVNLLLDKFTFIQLLFFNSIANVLTLFTITILTCKLGLLSNYQLSDLARLIFMSASGILVYLLFLYKAYIITDAQTAYILPRLWLVFVIIFSIFILNERFYKNHFIGFFLCFTNSVLLIEGFTFNIITTGAEFIGILFAMIAGISYALYPTMGKKYNEDRVTTMLIYYLIAVIFLLPLFLTENAPRTETTKLDLFGFFLVGGLVLGIRYLGWFLAMRVTG